MDVAHSAEHNDMVARLTEVARDFFQTTVRLHGRKQWEDIDLTMLQMRVLLLVAGCYGLPSHGMPMSQIARITAKTLSTVTGVVDRMVAQNLVRREHVPNDRRLVLVYATETGQALVDRLTEISDEHMHLIAERLTIEELTMVTNSLAVIQRAMHDVPQEALEALWDKYHPEALEEPTDTTVKSASK
jgi:DNA-binding MarR family transcriptional regulator